ncbi:MAG TPA: hypothetical protein VLT61_17510 [Anaeromyxobacteraceae bacterium]|nr:hypothetical protein [Anaeromyxobacteraceae bacterium]
MTWFRVDDKLHSHVKPARAGLAAMGAWVLAGSWCGDQLTDGRVPREIAHRIAPAAVWSKLVSAGLAETTDEGYQLHDFLDWNPSASAVKAERERKAEAGRRGGLASGASRSRTEARAQAPAEARASRLVPEAPELPTRPDPDPDPPKPPKGGKKDHTADDGYREAWTAGVLDAAPGAKFTPPSRMGLRFAQALQAHAQGLRGDDLRAWIRAKAAEWIRSCRYLRVISPAAFVGWLDGQSVEASRSQPEPDEEPVSPARRPFPSFDAIGRGGQA